MDATTRSELLARAGDAAVDAARLDALAAEAARHRRVEAAAEVERRRGELDDARANLARTQDRLAGALGARQAHLDEASWCETYTDHVEDAATRVAAARAAADVAGRTARDAARSLDRALEQRTAAEAAFADARAELGGRHAGRATLATDDASLRRELEVASHDLAATLEAHVLADDAERRAQEQLQAAVGSPHEAPARQALDDARTENSRRARDATAARRRVADLEDALGRATGPTDPTPPGPNVLDELHEQMRVLEDRLDQAEHAARAALDAANAELGRAERELETARHDERAIGRRLATTAEALRVPLAEDGDTEAEHAALVASACRAAARRSDTDVVAARQAVEGVLTNVRALAAELDDLEATGTVGGIVAEDLDAALLAIAPAAEVSEAGASRPAPVVDLTTAASSPAHRAALCRVVDAGLAGRCVAATDDPELLAWAVDLDADTGVVVNGQTVADALAEQPEPSVDETARIPDRPPMESTR